MAHENSWPLPHLAKAREQIGLARLWYTGDPDALSAHYAGGYGPTNSGRRTFWGRVRGIFGGGLGSSPNGQNQPNYGLHIPIASDLAVAGADSLFGDAPTYTLPDDAPEGAAERLATILEWAGWQSRCLEGAERACGLSGVYLRIVWDLNLAPHPFVAIVDPDDVEPVWSHGHLTEARFWITLPGAEKVVYRHRERHLIENGSAFIEHALFIGTEDALGRQVPLTEHPSTEALAAAVDEFGRLATGSPVLTAAYVPNVRPNRALGTDPVGQHMGRADTAGLEGLMDFLDETWTSLRRDIRLAKTRIWVAQSALETEGPGRAANFDTDREVLAGVDALLGDSGSLGDQMVAQQFAIRTEEHIATIRETLVQIARAAGYGVAVLGLDGAGSDATATEVNSRDRRTNSTRDKKIAYWTAGLSQILTALLYVDGEVFGGPGGARVSVHFPDAATPTLGETATSLQMLAAAEATSIRTRVQILHPQWGDEAVDNEVAAILAETGRQVMDLGDIPA